MACEFGDDWRSWMSDRRVVEIESYIEDNTQRFSRDHAAERIASYRERSTAALREAAACDHKATWQLERYSFQDECTHAVLWCSGCGALKDGNAWRLPSAAAPNPPKEPA